MTDFDHVFSLDNLRRAYRWVLSNPDARYKAFFRDSYDAFAIASDTHLRWIRQEGLKERYQPSHASKLHVPKPSGTLRPITLLTVDDQVVYQACVNLIADILRKKTRRRYDRSVFAHQYAGRSSPFFYKRWQVSYRKFGRSIIEAHADGYQYIADFDLASFYDSIDHRVLEHFLRDLSIDEDTINFLIDCLRTWTSSTWSTGPTNIYHGHGIPQGPLASGMLSEAVLQHIDNAGEQGRRTIYLRYVDDIKILAKTEIELRRKIIKLDLSSKEIGLFPQAAKLAVRKLADPQDEVKSVSRPIEVSVTPTIDQDKLVSRLLELTRGSKLDAKAVTRFKYLTSFVKPTHRLNSRLVGVLTQHPELAEPIAGYFGRYKKIPRRLAQEISAYVQGPELYHFVNGALLRSTLGRFPRDLGATLGRFCANRLVRPGRNAIPPQPSYKEALIAWSLDTNSVSFADFEKITAHELDWWVRKAGLRGLNAQLFGDPSYTALINRDLRNNNVEVSRLAAGRVFQEGLRIAKPIGNIEITAKRALKAVGVIRSAGQPKSRINLALAYILQSPLSSYDWQAFFGKEHRHAETMAILLKRNRETNIDAFLVQLDSFCDFVVSKIYAQYKPQNIYPAYGSALKDPLLGATLPRAVAALTKLHQLRLESATAHPRMKATGKPTRRLKHRDYHRIRPSVAQAFNEIETKFKP